MQLLRGDCKADSPASHRVKDIVREALQTATDPQDLNHRILITLQSLYPCKPACTSDHRKKDGVSGSIRLHWELWKKLKAAKPCTLQNMVRLWRTFADVRREKRVI